MDELHFRQIGRGVRTVIELSGRVRIQVDEHHRFAAQPDQPTALAAKVLPAHGDVESLEQCQQGVKLG